MDTENADVELSDGETDDSMDELEDMEEVSPSPVSLVRTLAVHALPHVFQEDLG